MKKSEKLGIIWFIFSVIILIIDIFLKHNFNVEFWGTLIISHIYFSKTTNDE